MKQPLPYWFHVLNMIASLAVAVFVVVRLPHSFVTIALCWFGAFFMVGASIRALRTAKQAPASAPRG
jgi:hypothetical protein